ncbi:MAG: DoxX family protein [Synechococcaceae bacterium WB8_1B_136]|nr:DoxX family protein [Synechococcaceae bacterium WB8_1B_136]
MALPLPLEIVAGVCASTLTIGLLRGDTASASIAPASTAQFTAPSATARALPPVLQGAIRGYLLGQGRLQSLGLLLLRLAVGVMMIHHGQDKLADPQSFASNYVAALHLPFPLLLAYAAGYAEILGSWLLIFGLFTPVGALALSGTMAVAGYHHILTSGLNIYVLELVVLYLGGSLGLLLLGPGRFSFDAGIAQELLGDEVQQAEDGVMAASRSRLTAAVSSPSGAV